MSEINPGFRTAFYTGSEQSRPDLSGKIQCVALYFESYAIKQFPGYLFQQEKDQRNYGAGTKVRQRIKKGHPKSGVALLKKYQIN